MHFSKLSVVSALAICVSGFRVRPKNAKQKSTTKGRPGRVTASFPMAAPGTAEPALQNPGPDGPCFPGFRSWTVKKQWFGNEVDLATTVTGVLGYRHPFQGALELDLKKNVVKEFPCNPPNTETPNIPRGLPKILHDWEFYVDAQQNTSDLLHKVGNVGIAASYTSDRAEAQKKVAKFGWNILGSAVDEGGSNYVGKQVSHLIQQPETKECILTFQGSSSPQDWAANFNVKRSHFCGFVGATESCEDDTSTCVVASAGESFVHQGFRDALRAIVQNPDFQSDVRPKFSQCSKVYVTGHSLGGAQAELFTACANQGLQPGQYGYEEDYKYIGWTV